MNKQILQMGCAAALFALAGCTDLKPLQADIATLKAQITRLQSESQATRQAAEQATSSAQSSSQVAAGAQSSANQAMAAAQSSHACCDTLNEKVDRIFKRSLSK